ncbi:MAG: ABC transporter permease [Clostridia bacterium]
MTEFLSYLTSFFYAAVLAGVPLLFGTVGEIITEKSGNLNLGVEGLMYIGALTGFLAGYITDSAMLTIVFAFVGGALGAGIYALLTVTLKANQNVTGLTLTIFGAGFANYMGDALINASPTKMASLSPAVKAAFKAIHIPVLSDIPYIGRLLFQYNLFVYLGIVVAIVAGFYLKYTRTGLNLRAVGENPAAADAMGININKYKYLNIMLGGGICGIGGAYVSVVTCGGNWTFNSVNGLGWIALALVIFASWSPYRAILGSLIFGALSILRMYIPNTIISIPPAIFAMLPFVVTCVVLVVTSIRMSRERSQPMGCGVNYYREER